MNDKANGTKPISGLDKTVKAEVSAGPKNKTLDFDLDDVMRPHYTATFFPSAQTTYTYTLNGTINDTPIHVSYTCVPGSGDDTLETITRRHYRLEYKEKESQVVLGVLYPRQM